MKKLYLSFLLLLTFATSFSQCWQKIVTNSNTTIGLKTDGTLWSWGKNSLGLLGRGLPVDQTVYPMAQIGSDNDWSSNIYFGPSTVLALKNNGKLYAWGLNDSGMLSNDTITPYILSPQQIGNDNWITVDTSGYIIAGIKQDGTLWVWGNVPKLLGSPPPATYFSYVPVQIGSDTDWVTVSVGYRYGCAIKQDGSMWCWGRSTANDNRYFSVMPGDNWLKVSCDMVTRFAIKTDGTLWAWGYEVPISPDNFFYGNGLIDSNNYTANIPIQVGTDADWVDIVNSLRSIVALKNNNTMWVWGENSHGELGDGTFIDRYVPTQIGASINWIDATSGRADWRPRFYAFNENHDLYKWGYDLDENIQSVTSTIPVLSGTTCTLNVDDFDNQEVVVYPNPSNDFFNIQIGNGFQIQKLELYNELGQLLYISNTIEVNSNILRVDAKEYARGVYFIKVHSNNANKLIRVIKN